jgi:hypothetical protein
MSPVARALLHAAKSDAPGAAARAQIWGAVSSAAGLAAAGEAGAAAGAGLGATAVASGKLLVVGALLGSALTAGLGFAVVRWASDDRREDRRGDRHSAAEMAQVAVAAPPLPRSPDARGPALHASEPTDEAPTRDVERRSEEGSPREIAESLGAAAHRDPQSASVLDIDAYGRNGLLLDARSASGEVASRSSEAGRSGEAGRTPAGPPGPHLGREDPLGREAALVAEASGAVRRGDAEAALALLDAAGRLGSHRMEPEELSIRVRALRSLRRDSEATETEAHLKAKYPDHFLAR